MSESYCRNILAQILTSSNSEYEGIWELMMQSDMMTNLDDLIHNYIESEFCYAILTTDNVKIEKLQ